jgi:putative intracellular protease/amidase
MYDDGDVVQARSSSFLESFNRKATRTRRLDEAHGDTSKIKQEANTMSKGKLLVVGSNATQIEVQGVGWGPTGNYLNETVVPIMAVIGAGYDVQLATPDGTRPHMDKASDSAVHFGGNQSAYIRARAFWTDDPTMNQVRTLRSMIEEGLDNYAGVFVPGGQAPVVDLMQDSQMGEILHHFHDQAKPTALLCHGPIALVSAMPRAREFRAALMAGDEAKAKELAKGWQYAGYGMTIFSASEEKWVEKEILHGKMYFTMPQALEAAGGDVTATKVDFEPHVVVDRELITGQNPRSDHAVGEKLVEALDNATSQRRPNAAAPA